MASTATTSRERIRIGGLPIDRLTFAQALDGIEALVAARQGGFIFTPNVDHVVEFAENASLRDAYERADLSLADGMPIVWASRLLGEAVPEKVSGSDLVTPLLERAAARGWRVYFLGANDGVAAKAREKATATFPRLQIVGTLSPRIDLSQPPASRADVVEAVKAASPDLVLVAFGAPKQELFIAEAIDALRPAVLLGIGASLDFLAGSVPRAPAWMSKHGLEWAYRLAREPRRLWKRYLLRDPKFAVILLHSMLKAQRS